MRRNLSKLGACVMETSASDNSHVLQDTMYIVLRRRPVIPFIALFAKEKTNHVDLKMKISTIRKNKTGMH